jgi:phage N-6-adenine-methyltransferase
MTLAEVLPPLDKDAIDIGALYRKGCKGMADSVRYMIEAGRRLLAKKAELDHGEWIPWLEANADALGFETRMTATRLMNAAAKCNVDVTFDDQKAIEASRTIWGNHNVRGTQGTGENEWYTPEKYILLARKVLGKIDLDPASSEKANKIVRANEFYSETDNGLTKQWNGKVWLNPPYAQPLIEKFVEKMVEERSSGRVTEAIMLTHNYTDTSWFHKACEIADAICFTRGRIKFVDADRNECGTPTQGQAFFYFGGDNIESFKKTFIEVGFIFTPCAMPRTVARNFVES